MINSVGSVNLASTENQETKENKPVNIITRLKAQNEHFKDAFIKSDDATKSKINTFLPLVSAAGVIAMLAGHKKAPVRYIGALVSIVASAFAINLNLGKDVNPAAIIKKAAPKEEETAPVQEAQPALSPQEAEAINVIASNEGVNPSPADIFKQTTQG